MTKEAKWNWWWWTLCQCIKAKARMILRLNTSKTGTWKANASNSSNGKTNVCVISPKISKIKKRSIANGNTPTIPNSHLLRRPPGRSWWVLYPRNIPSIIHRWVTHRARNTIWPIITGERTWMPLMESSKWRSCGSNRLISLRIQALWALCSEIRSFYSTICYASTIKPWSRWFCHGTRTTTVRF